MRTSSSTSSGVGSARGPSGCSGPAGCRRSRGMGYPLVPGYESVGRVRSAGERSGNARVGDRVFVPGARCFRPGAPACSAVRRRGSWCPGARDPDRRRSGRERGAPGAGRHRLSRDRRWWWRAAGFDRRSWRAWPVARAPRGACKAAIPSSGNTTRSGARAVPATGGRSSRGRSAARLSRHLRRERRSNAARYPDRPSRHGWRGGRSRASTASRSPRFPAGLHARSSDPDRRRVEAAGPGRRGRARRRRPAVARPI